MKKWVLVLAVLALIGGYALIQRLPGAAEANPVPGAGMEVHREAGGTAAESGGTTRPEAGAPGGEPAVPEETTPTIEIAEDQVYRGSLILVDQDHPVRPEAVVDDVVKLYGNKELVRGYGLLNDSIRLSRAIAEKFLEMTSAAKRDGVKHFLISSGYRTEDEQEELFRQMGAESAMPAGHSEHNLGLSLDIGSTEDEMSRAPEGKWLSGNAWKYGFILRYPKDKTEVTGIKFEPWHFRYVGLPHSMIMKKKNLALEEYLEFLKEKKVYSASANGVKYEISYYPVAGKATVPVPESGEYEISGDNIGGVIVTSVVDS